MIYIEDLDKLTVTLQQEIDSGNGFDENHIFYRLIASGLAAANSKPGQFTWNEDIIEFANSIEAAGGAKTINLLRGPGFVKQSEPVSSDRYWDLVNIPFPSKSTSQRRKGAAITDNGVISHNLKNFQKMCELSSERLIDNDTVSITPICLSRDAMAVKPSGDWDKHTNQIVGLDFPIDLDYIKAHPDPDPEYLQKHMNTEAGAIVATSLDNMVSLMVANDFLTKSTPGESVYTTVINSIQAVQICENCLLNINSDIVSVDITQTQCDCLCKDCILNISEHELAEPCERCTLFHSSPCPQLRACKRCETLGIKCKKLAVLALSMDCESNNAAAMRKLDLKSDSTSPYSLLTYSVPDVVHAGKKVFRASANWWLLVNGYRVNNSLLRSLRQFDIACSPDLKVVVSDTALRNRDRMDYSSIVQSTGKELQSAIKKHTQSTGSYVTHTFYPDLFWKSRFPSIMRSVTDICLGRSEAQSVLPYIFFGIKLC